MVVPQRAAEPRLPMNSRPRFLVAISAMVGASALVAVTMLIAKTLGLGAGGNSLHPLQVSAGRFVFALSIIGSVGLWMRPSFVGTAWRLHVGRSVCGWLGVTFLFAAAARMPLADATAISFLSPLVTMGLAALLLNERVQSMRWVAALVALAGALVLIRPGTDAFQPMALIALAAAGFMGFEVVLVKKLSDGEVPIRILVINNTIGAAIASVAASFVWVWPSFGQWVLLFILGAAMAGAQGLFIQALKRTDASRVIPFFYMTLIFVTIYDFVLFGAFPGAVAIAGAVLIVGGVLFLTLPLSGRGRRAARLGTGSAVSKHRPK